ncbi:MAG: tetratricopeptide repeat protein [Desulfovibrionaceae bacterium]|nr:tetratricopeptide repeat protein [Desulfovibrionaceae bacterium]
MRRNFLHLCLVVVLLAACAGRESAPPPPDARGLSGKRSEEAELLFAKAHVLWKGDTCTEPLEAVQMLDEAIAKDPDFAAAWVYRGLAHSELGKREEAFDDLTKAIRLEPRAEYYADRGLVSLRAGVFSAARRDLDYSLKKDQKQYRAWNILGETALREGNTEQACAYYARGCSNGNCEPLQRARKDGRCK